MARLLARTLIAALLVGLIPAAPAGASIRAPEWSRSLPTLPLAESVPPSFLAVVVAVAGDEAAPCAVVFAIADPHFPSKYHRARWMDPRVGRFSATDPHPGSIEEPLTLHRYVYAGADPVNNTDPSGLFFSLSVSFASFGISATINAISVPITRSMINATASLELVPIWVRDRNWKGEPERPLLPFPGWPLDEMQSHLSNARSLWGSHGITLHIGREIGPALVGNSTIYSNDQIPEILKDPTVNLATWPPNKVPVIFVRSIGGTSTLGKATTNPRKPALVLMTRGAVDSTLSHELGHTLGLEHTANPFGLMFPVNLGQTYLSGSEVAKAREGLLIRNGGLR